MFRIVFEDEQDLGWFNGPMPHFTVETDAINAGKRRVEKENKVVVVQKWSKENIYEKICEIRPVPSIKAKVVYNLSKSISSS